MEKYEVVKYLGAGSFGVANLCRDKETDELVAIKFIQRGPTIDENVEREIINHRSLRHPNIILFKDVILTPTHLALVMEYASGGELFQRISNWGRLTEDEARYFFQQLIFGIDYIHSKQICHRDVKLDNILLDGKKSPHLKICDFGYSKRIRRRDLKQDNILLHRRKSSHMKKCDFDSSKQICHRGLMLESNLLDGSPSSKLKARLLQDRQNICHKDSMLDSLLLDGCRDPQLRICALGLSKQIYQRGLKLDNILLHKRKSQDMKKCDVGYSKQICNRDLVLDNTLSDESPAPQLRTCDFGFSKLHFKSTTNVGTETYAAPEVLYGREYDGKIADVWSCGVTLYVMLVAAYPFEDPNDTENSEKTIKRIMAGGYEIPDHVNISKDCQHLLSCIFVRKPSERISIKEIMNHPWFSKNLKRELTELARDFISMKDNPTSGHDQSVEEIRKIVRTARKQLAPSSTAIIDYILKTEEEHKRGEG